MSVLHFEPKIAYGGEGLFSIANDEDVDEVAHGFWIDRRRSAGKNQRIIHCPIDTMQWNTSEIQNRENVGKRQFILQRKTEDIEFSERRKRFERIEGQVMLSQGMFHIGIGSEDTFARPVGLPVHESIEQLQSIVAHSDSIDIGKSEAESSLDGVFWFDNASEFSADVLPRQIDFREEQGFDFGPHKGIIHEKYEQSA